MRLSPVDAFRRHRGPAIVLALIAVLFAVDQVRLYRAMHGGVSRTDLERWLPIAADFLRHPDEPLYERHPDYLYPPWFLLAVWPFGKLPLPVAAFAAQTIKWAALLCCVRWVFDMGGDPPHRLIPPLAAIGSLVCSARFFINEMAELNVNILILCGVLGGAMLVRRGRPIWAGAVLAVVAAVKVTPALVVLYFVFKGHWRVLAGAAIGLAATLLVAPALAVGWDANLATLSDWCHHVITGFVRSGSVYSPHFNQSLTGWLNRLFTPAVAFEPDGRMTLVELPPVVLASVRATLFIAVLVVLVWAIRGRPGAETPPAVLGELGLVLIAMLLLSGYSWKAHYVALFPGYAAALAYLAEGRQERRKLIGWLVGISFALCTLTSDIIGPRLADWAEAIGLIMFGAIALAGALIAVRSSLRDKASAPR